LRTIYFLKWSIPGVHISSAMAGQTKLVLMFKGQIL
jgi:hypothetical protein